MVAAASGWAGGPAAAAPADSVQESPPAPLLIPGRSAPADTAGKSPAERAREYFRLGVGLERARQPGPAITAYNNALLLDKAFPEANYRIGVVYLSGGQFRPAVARFRAELSHHPEHIEAARHLGLGLAQMGDTAAAIAQLERLARRRPTDDETWRALGFAYSAANRTQQAEAALRRAATTKPERAVEHRDLGALMATLGRDAEASGEYRRALKLDPTDASVWYNLGNLERRSGRMEQALVAYREASARDSNFSLAVQGQVRALIELRRESEAGAVYRRWLRARPDDHNARLEAVRFFTDLGRGDVALEMARDGVRRDPRSGDAHVTLGIALHATGSLRAALRELRKAGALAASPLARQQVERLVANLRAAAPDSLRALFAADSVAHAKAR